MITNPDSILRACALPCLLLALHTSAAAISPDRPDLLQQQILAAYAAGQRSVVIPAGTYQVPVQGGNFHLFLPNLNNFEIDATGVTLVFQDVKAGGIQFANSNGVSFHGATLYYATPPFSQGVIRKVAADGTSIDVQIEPGYPTNLDDPQFFPVKAIVHIFDSATRWWKRNVYGDLSGTKTERLSADTFHIFTNFTAGAAVGDLVAIRGGSGNHMIAVQMSSNMILKDLTILNSPVFGIVEAFSGAQGANHYLGITIKRGNRPAGASTDPLYSTNIDGFHSIAARQGPDVENCSFESMPDDGIAISGFFLTVIEASGRNLIVSTPFPFVGAYFSVGDPLRLIDASDQPAGDAVVTAITALPSYQNSRKSARQTTADFTIGPYYQITLDRVLQAGFDYVAADPSWNGAGYVIRNNTIKNHRARGMILKADNGLVEGNTIDGSTMTGIWLGPEFYWAEGGYVHNVTVRNNTIRNVAYWGGQTAALVVAADQVIANAGAFQNIVIDGNTFLDFDTTGIFASGVAGLTITNNRFVNPQNAAPYALYNRGENVPPGTLVYVTHSSSVQVQGNTTSLLGAANAEFLVTAPGTTVNGMPSVTVVAGSDADFSSTQGAANWSYGYFPSGDINAFTLLPTYNSQFSRWQHVTFGPPWTSLSANSFAHPNGSNNGAEEWAVRRWISTAAGSAKISGHLAKDPGATQGTGIFGRIYLNHNLIYEKYIAGGDSAGVDYSLDASLSRGDILDFAVAPNGIDAFDGTRFSSTITVLSAGSATLSPVSVSPSSGPAGAQATSFSFTYTDPAGFQDIGVANILINPFLDGRSACYVALVPRDATSWSLFLVDNEGDAGGPYAGMVIPGTGLVSNGQCSISAAGASVTGAGDNLTVVLPVSFAPSFAGDKVIYLADQTRAGANSGWRAKGVLRVVGNAPTVTSVAGMTPGRAIPVGRTPFTFTFSDTNGTADIGVANILINQALDARSACYLALAYQSNTLYLMNDAGTALLPGANLAAPGALANTQCTVSWGSAPVAVAGSSLSLTLNIALAAQWSGLDLVTYAAVRDKNEGNSTGWHAVGTQGSVSIR